jgi:hypothetical protein
MRCGGFGSDRDRLPFRFFRAQAEFGSDYRFRFAQRKKAARNVRRRCLAFTSILKGARAGLYPLLDLNSVEPPIGPNPEGGYFAAFEQLINGRRMNFQKLGHFFYG